jgi:glycosyltransferase involved in cell wall biosynthesis
MPNDLKIIAIMGYDSCYGAEKANLQVLSLLRDGGAQVHCLVRNDILGESFIRLATTRGFPIYPASFGPSIFGLHYNLFKYLANIAGMVRVSFSLIRLQKQVKATHIHIPNYLQFLYCWPALLLLRLPVVFRIGDPPEKSWLHCQLWGRLIVPCVSEFVTNSEFTRQRLLFACGKAIRSRVIKNCAATHEGTADYRSRPEFSRDGHLITYLGQMNPSKGIHLAVDAAIEVCRTHDKIAFHFVGVRDPVSDFVADLQRQIEVAGFTDRIVFRPYVNDVRESLRNSILHLCPSIQDESSANVVLDAKQAGVPSIVFPRGGLPELVRHKVDGYVCASADAVGLLQGILYFLDDRVALEQASECALAAAATHAPDAIRPEWERVFADCVSQ